MTLNLPDINERLGRTSGCGGRVEGKRAVISYSEGKYWLASGQAPKKQAARAQRESSGGDELGRERKGASEEERQYPLRKGVLESWKVMGMEEGRKCAKLGMFPSPLFPFFLLSFPSQH